MTPQPERPESRQKDPLRAILISVFLLIAFAALVGYVAIMHNR